jgi:hypothetical protein
MCAFTTELLRTAAANEWYVSCICVYLLLPQPCVCAAVILLPPVYVCRWDTAATRVFMSYVYTSVYLLLLSQYVSTTANVRAVCV